MNAGTEAVHRRDRQRAKDREEQAYLRAARQRSMDTDDLDPAELVEHHAQLKREFLERDALRAA